MGQCCQQQQFIPNPEYYFMNVPQNTLANISTIKNPSNYEIQQMVNIVFKSLLGNQKSEPELGQHFCCGNMTPQDKQQFLLNYSQFMIIFAIDNGLIYIIKGNNQSIKDEVLKNQQVIKGLAIFFPPNSIKNGKVFSTYKLIKTKLKTICYQNGLKNGKSDTNIFQSNINNSLNIKYDLEDEQQSQTQYTDFKSSNINSQSSKNSNSNSNIKQQQQQVKKQKQCKIKQHIFKKIAIQSRCKIYYSLLQKMHNKYAKNDHWYLQYMGVLPEYQNQGIGGQFMKFFNHLIDSYNVVGYLESNGTKNRTFFTKHGFRVVDKIMPNIDGKLELGVLNNDGGTSIMVYEPWNDISMDNTDKNINMGSMQKNEIVSV